MTPVEQKTEPSDGFADERLWRHAALVDLRRDVEDKHKRNSDSIKALFNLTDAVKAEIVKIQKELSDLGWEIKLINNNGFVARIDALDKRADSLESTRTWGKGVLSVIGILWTVLLLYIAVKLKNF